MTRSLHLTPFALIGLTLASCAAVNDRPSSAQSDASAAQTAVASAQFTGRTPETAGKAQLFASPTGLTLTATLTGLPPGVKGFHLHETGTCDAPAFTTAGAHLNPLGKSHGTMAEGGAHLGDLPNLSVAQDGTATITAQIDGEPSQLVAWLFDADGTSIMVHEGPDDYTTDPSGAAGPRIACAILTKP